MSKCPAGFGGVFSTDAGVPQPDPVSYQTAGKNGPILLQDHHLIESIQAHNRERIPERVVHAKGAGAIGTWETTAGAEDICCADIMKPGKKASVVVRFSTVGGESGSSDTARDPRGWAIKVKTEEGNWDVVANNTPVFFIKSPHSFLHLIHTQKRNPQTHLKDADAFWSFFALNPESAHQLMILFSRRGITSFAKMNAYGGHTFKMVNKQGEWVYVQFHFLSEKGVKGYTQEEGDKLSGENPDSGTQELFEMIEKGDYPTWKVCIQTMTLEQAKKFRYSVFDLTKVWPHKEFPLREIAKVTLNENPENYFAQVEQAAFSPAHLVPGIEPSNDPVLQARLFSYADAHRYRLTVNYNQLPINCPVTGIHNFNRDGVMAGAFNNNQGSAPNYPAPNDPKVYKKRPYTLEQISEPTEDMRVMLGKIDDGGAELDFEQPRGLWEKVFDDEERDLYVKAVSGHLGNAKPSIIRDVLDKIYYKISPELGEKIEKAIGNSEVKTAKSAVNGYAGMGYVPADE